LSIGAVIPTAWNAVWTRLNPPDNAAQEQPKDKAE
jgi:hypothetical protein